MNAMPKAKELMTRSVIAISPDMSVDAVARLLAGRGISAAPVLDKAGHVLGVVTEADLIARLAGLKDPPIGFFRSLFTDPEARAERYARTHGVTARDIMTEGAIFVGPDATADEIAHLMEEKHIRRVLVLEDGKLLGIVSRADLLRALVDPVTIPQELPDAEIREAVLTAMKREPWANGFYTTVQVEEGVVRFEGFVQHEGIRRGLQVLAMNVPGVRAVLDNTQPMPAGMMAAV
ncbi:CBS domain-containing protein [Rhodovarius lipocyclicus]|jgi:CBS domain-containing protein|uniref:CBS domain-containing protein n=1 Tax=Rhodovarius lipocyclicus TaxID=268410 RepID=UPI001F4039AB|nr:CBS domain-containing protein [Rhodovarius lipocyclicus]